MADKSNIIITMNDHVSGKEQQKTITDINPSASSSKLATWGAMTAALSKDSYVKTTRIDKTECDDEAEKAQFLTNISMGIWSTTESKKNWVNIINKTDTIEVPFLSANNQALTVQLKSSSLELSKDFPGLPKLTFSNANWSMSSTSQSMTGTNDNAFLCNFRYATQQEETFTMTVTVPGNNNYAEFNKTYTIHFYDSEAGE